jgi:hypothetical protein
MTTAMCSGLPEGVIESAIIYEIDYVVNDRAVKTPRIDDYGRA